MSKKKRHVQIGQVWKHCATSNMYLIEKFTTDCSSEKTMVIYKSLKDNRHWNRELEEFLSPGRFEYFGEYEECKSYFEKYLNPEKRTPSSVHIKFYPDETVWGEIPTPKMEHPTSSQRQFELYAQQIKKDTEIKEGMRSNAAFASDISSEKVERLQETIQNLQNAKNNLIKRIQDLEKLQRSHDSIVNLKNHLIAELQASKKQIFNELRDSMVNPKEYNQLNHQLTESLEKKLEQYTHLEEQFKQANQSYFNECSELQRKCICGGLKIEKLQTKIDSLEKQLCSMATAKVTAENDCTLIKIAMGEVCEEKQYLKHERDVINSAKNDALFKLAEYDSEFDKLHKEIQQLQERSNIQANNLCIFIAENNVLKKRVAAWKEDYNRENFRLTGQINDLCSENKKLKEDLKKCNPENLIAIKDVKFQELESSANLTISDLNQTCGELKEKIKILLKEADTNQDVIDSLKSQMESDSGTLKRENLWINQQHTIISELKGKIQELESTIKRLKIDGFTLRDRLKGIQQFVGRSE